MFADAQAAFATALLDPEAPVPSRLGVTQGTRIAKRFAVYRNNVAASLADALATRFPVVRTIVGEDFFRAAARVFVAGHRPRSPLLMTYGDDFPDFLDGFSPASGLPYLGDLARLEAARTRAYHAADRKALSPDELAAIPAGALADLRLRLHPAAEIVFSDHPIVTLWERHQSPEPDLTFETWTGETALISRPDLIVEIRAVPPGAAAFLQALRSGLSLGEAASETMLRHDRFDLSEALGIALSSSALTLCRQEDEPCRPLPSPP